MLGKQACIDLIQVANKCPQVSQYTKHTRTRQELITSCDISHQQTLSFTILPLEALWTYKRSKKQVLSTLSFDLICRSPVAAWISTYQIWLSVNIQYNGSINIQKICGMPYWLVNYQTTLCVNVHKVLSLFIFWNAWAYHHRIEAYHHRIEAYHHRIEAYHHRIEASSRK